ncbi:Deoxyguanosinetriphosphate triphosphohydrolase-like protein [Halomicronema hongdechloris C2206]|uniref:Deoxyguanosinetriphosphate triphosphohydrolase-like protein n=1 Tax=Halomicronema hongdechloris C2206 TaxID=1641165 RepID=A0A1Z3HHT3_9CYAN|nr:HD domain-containing protein [Halomicronema hongdechloris]ASC69831.1 Deoxyguanosinetriphosphate triphosphohydrolase-like protein [Halomicronema hongdechloris C2206]
MPSKPYRTYHDPLHGAITLDGQEPTEALLIRLIDTSPFQRLRRIRQLGPASLTFHGAESSRFTHSLGVMFITRRVFDRLAQEHPILRSHRTAVLCAALLHDIGHGPFSHTAENIFGCHHEQWTRRILQQAPEVRSQLQQVSPDLIAAIDQIYTHQHPVPLVWQIVSSQLDCDRLDYLLRDSYFTGARYGHLDLDRILMALEMDTLTQQLVVARKGLAAIEHYLVVRYFMYAQVYNHPKNLTAAWVLEQALQRARELLYHGALDADATVQAWLTQPNHQLALDTYLSGDDIVFLYHLHRWQHHSDPLLSDLCRRFLDRDLLKALEVTPLPDNQHTALLQMLQHQMQQQGWEAARYSGLRRIWSRGYTLYQHGILVRTGNGLQDINQLSPVVQTLTQAHARLWLLYPRAWEQSAHHLYHQLQQRSH